MSFLSDRHILLELDKGNIICTPFNRENLSNSSIDLRLGAEFEIVKPYFHLPSCRPHTFNVDENGKVETVFSPDCDRKKIILREPGDTLLLPPGGFVLASTLEYVGSNAPHILGQISDKSTMARLGLSTFFGAGYIDPVNSLNITLEIKNNSHAPIALQYAQHICQIRFAYLSSDVSHPYNGKYLNSTNLENAK